MMPKRCGWADDGVAGRLGV